MIVALFSSDGEEGVGIVKNGEVADLRAHYGTPAEFFLANGSSKDPAVRLSQEAPVLPLSHVALRAPLAPDTKIFAIAANYRSHAEEIGGEPPTQPVIFNKFFASMVHPNEPIQLSPLSQEMDYEGELAAVIGRQARNVTAAEALEYVGGYTLLNDVSARDLQMTTLGGRTIIDWFSGKALQKSSPAGPWIVTADEIANPQDLRLVVEYNGQVVQDESTSDMVFGVADIIDYISERITLEPGDVIATGTPAGVGKYRDLKLQNGDTVKVEIGEIGALTNPVRSLEQ